MAALRGIPLSTVLVLTFLIALLLAHFVWGLYLVGATTPTMEPKAWPLALFSLLTSIGFLFLLITLLVLLGIGGVQQLTKLLMPKNIGGGPSEQRMDERRGTTENSSSPTLSPTLSSPTLSPRGSEGWSRRLTDALQGEDLESLSEKAKVLAGPASPERSRLLAKGQTAGLDLIASAASARRRSV